MVLSKYESTSLWLHQHLGKLYKYCVGDCCFLLFLLAICFTTLFCCTDGRPTDQPFCSWRGRDWRGAEGCRLWGKLEATHNSVTTDTKNVTHFKQQVIRKCIGRMLSCATKSHARAPISFPAAIISSSVDRTVCIVSLLLYVCCLFYLLLFHSTMVSIAALFSVATRLD